MTLTRTAPPDAPDAGERRSEQRARIATGTGFIAALDQSGGSAPVALRRYGLEVADDASTQEILDLMHRWKGRVLASPSLTADGVVGAILFEDSLDRSIDGLPVAEYLWRGKRIVPFVKIDRGMAGEVDGSQLMQPIDGLDRLLERLVADGVFGTKMRSLVTTGGDAAIGAIVDQQFAVARRVLAAGLVPIVEPEISISHPDKAEAERSLLRHLTVALDGLGDGVDVMLKLTLPTVDDLYAPLVEHPRVLRVVALSGGYSQAESIDRLARNHGVIASFSRALTEGLGVDQADDEFDAVLAASIAEIAAASAT